MPFVRGWREVRTCHMLENAGRPTSQQYTPRTRSVNFNKKFDKVLRGCLLEGLKVIGFGAFLRWITHFRNKHYLHAGVSRSDSRRSPITFGAPQGLVIGMLPRLVRVSDAQIVFECHSLNYGDDVRLWCAIPSEADAETLHSELTKPQWWTRAQKMPINFANCKYVRIWCETQSATISAQMIRYRWTVKIFEPRSPIKNRWFRLSVLVHQQEIC